MDILTLNFKVVHQRLTGQFPIKLASNTVSYVKAVFDLGDGWDVDEYDAIEAIWHNDVAVIATVLNVNHECVVPWEVLSKKSRVFVNLVAYESVNDVLVTRMTSYPIKALIVDADALVSGTETVDPTPSLFEQFIAEVHGYAQDAYTDKLISEGFAVGEQNGEPVESGTYYHNNAKYYSEQAESSSASAVNSATLAEESAYIAVNKAEEASASASSANDSAGSASSSASNAQASANTASSKANEASGYATIASEKAEEASGYASNASDKADEAAASAEIAQSLSQTMYMKSDGLFYISVEEAEE